MIIRNPSIPNEKNDQAIQDTFGSIMNGLQGLLSQGRMNDILKMFTGQKTSSAVSQQISVGFIQNLMDKFGLNQ